MSEFLHIITDPAHVLAELFFIAVEGVLISPIVAFLVRRHDRRKHGKHVCPPSVVRPIKLVANEHVPPNTGYLINRGFVVDPATITKITELTES